MDNGLRDLTRQPAGPRFPLTDGDEFLLITAFLTAGRWSELGLSEAEAAELLLGRLKSLKRHDHDQNRRMFVHIQDRLMAIRKGDFYRIQLEPPFSNDALRHLNRLDDAWKSRGADGYYLQWKNTFTPAVLKQQQGVSVLAITGGPGDTEHSAFCIEAIDPFAKVNAEYWYLYYVFGLTFELRDQLLTAPNKDGRQFDVVEIRMSDGASKTFFFDVTSNFLNGKDRYDFAKCYE